MNEQTKEKISRLQLIQQSLSTLVNQKQQLHSQLLEITAATQHVTKTSSAPYKIMGSIMVQQSVEEVQKGLEEDKKKLEIRISALEKQEQTISQKAKSLQEEILSEMEKKE